MWCWRVGLASVAIMISTYPVSAASNRQMSYEPIRPLEQEVGLPIGQVRLGQALFHDPLLSSSGQVSCASCHDIRQGGGAIAAPYMKKLPNGEIAKVSVPTIFGVGLNFRHRWDGSGRNLADQVDGPLSNAGMMGSNWPDVIRYLKKTNQYKDLFRSAFEDGAITEQNARQALIVYQRFLTPINSPFDQYLYGNKEAISLEAIEGYRLFKRYGCASCHQGRNVGGNMFQKLGVVEPYYSSSNNRGYEAVDLGLYHQTGKEQDRHVYKVPTLRNIVLTAPYLHDGSVETLDKVVDIMAKHQLGRVLSSHDRNCIVAFLQTLTGEIGPLSAP
jgi:cytochrome c peroxidase